MCSACGTGSHLQSATRSARRIAMYPPRRHQRGKLDTVYCGNVNELAPTLLQFLKDGDVLLNMGAGSINKVPQALLDLSGVQHG